MLIFLPIPKCASRSIQSVIPFEDWHRPINISGYLNKLRAAGTFDAFMADHKFAVIRHPASRLSSVYYFVTVWSISPLRKRSNEHLRELFKPFKSFAEFVSGGLEKLFESCTTTPMFWPQSIFIEDRKLGIIPDTLLRLESLDVEWPPFAEKWGLPLKLPRHHSQTYPRWQDELGRNEMKIIEKVYQSDYRLLGVSGSS